MPDSWIRQRALTSRRKSGSGGLPRPPALPFESPLTVCSVTGSKISARQLHQSDGRNRSHHGPDEAGPGKGHIGNRGPVGVLALGAQANAAVGNTRDDGGGIEDAARGRERALQLVAADDLPHIHEDRRVGVAQLDDVEEHLLLPGVGHRRGVVEPVTVKRGRTVARAAGEAGRAHQDTDPRGKGTTVGHRIGTYRSSRRSPIRPKS